MVKVGAALAARQRAGAIIQLERNQAVSFLLHQYANEYHGICQRPNVL